jgi:hypothetical protein
MESNKSTNLGTAVKIPGYTGFMPYKNDLVGLTTGRANKVSQQAYENETKKGVLGQTGSYLMQ